MDEAKQVKEFTETGPLKVLSECRALLVKKSKDYQNPSSNVKQAMHYRRGIDTLHDTLQGKLYRAQSLIESGENANFESLEDTYKDIVNYAAFCVAWLRKEIDGQDQDKNMFNQPRSFSIEIAAANASLRGVALATFVPDRPITAYPSLTATIQPSILHKELCENGVCEI